MSQSSLSLKQQVVSEIKDAIQNSKSVSIVEYRGLTVSEISDLRNKYRAEGVSYKVFKNTLMARAFNDLSIDLSSSLEGPSALAFGTDAIAPIKVLSDFAKTHPALILKVGIVDGEISDQKALAELAKIPSREGLLTMLAGALIGIPKDLSICLDLYAKQKEEN